LTGITPKRALGKYTLIRPIIYCSKAEIYEFCQKNSLCFVFDKTNDDTAYSRNYIRKNIIPSLEKINPEVVLASANLSKIQRDSDDFIKSVASEFINSHKILNEIPIKPLAALHRAVCSRVIIQVFSSISNQALTFEHIEGILSLFEKENGARLSLPGGVCAIVNGEALSFVKENGGISCFENEFKLPLSFGVNYFENKNFAVYLTNEQDFDANIYADLKNIYKLSITAEINFDKIIDGIYLRNRQRGDKYVFYGVNHSVKTILSDAKIPSLRRNALPVFCDGNGIIFVPGFPIRDDVFAKKGEKKTTIYYFEK